jgi:hypothetical protein
MTRGIDGHGGLPKGLRSELTASRTYKRGIDRPVAIWEPDTQSGDPCWASIVLNVRPGAPERPHDAVMVLLFSGP